MTEIDSLHLSPAYASDEDFEWLVDIDEVGATVTGGLRRDGISTGSVNDGLSSVRRILQTHTARMNAQQRSAPKALELVLRRS